MKTDKQNIDLEGLLAEVEHAGRDARRRQELGEMIDQLAATPQSLSDSSSASGEQHRRHGAWWWTSRVAAAACILFFISTAVRIWFIPTEEAVQVAQTEVPVTKEVLPVAPSPVEEPEVTIAPAPRIKRSSTVQPVVETPEQQPVEELLAEEVALPEVVEPLDTVEVPVVIIEDDVVPDTEQIAEAAVREQPSKVPLHEEPQTELKKASRGNFLRSLFRLAEPSNMDGTTLALLEF